MLRRVWNSSSSRANTVTTLFPGLSGMSAGKSSFEAVARLRQDLEEDLLLVHEHEHVAQAGAGIGRRGARARVPCELPGVALDDGRALLRVGRRARCAAARAATPRRSRRSAAPRRGASRRRRRRTRTGPSATRPGRTRRPARRTGSTAPFFAVASGRRRRRSRRSGASPRRPRPGPSPRAAPRACSSFATGQSSFSETYSSIFSSTIIDADRAACSRLRAAAQLDLHRARTSTRRASARRGRRAPS